MWKDKEIEYEVEEIVRVPKDVYLELLKYKEEYTQLVNKQKIGISSEHGVQLTPEILKELTSLEEFPTGVYFKFMEDFQPTWHEINAIKMQHNIKLYFTDGDIFEYNPIDLFNDVFVKVIDK